MKKIIDLPHHLDNYECMWNGIEDLYIGKTGETLPPKLFFALASFGTFSYIRQDEAKLKRLISFGDARTGPMYEFLAPIVGFDFKRYEYETFEEALAKGKSEIDNGFPCVLGTLDMYYLPYFRRIYHKEHIPFHYVLMVGYDEEEGLVYLHDCGRENVMALSCDDLRIAWDCSYPDLSRPFTLCTIRMGNVRSQYEIARIAFARKKELFLHSPTDSIGYRGMEKLIEEFPAWKSELSKEDYDRALAHFVKFLGTAPTTPNALLGIDAPDLIRFGGGFDRISTVLQDLGEECNDETMVSVGKIFSEGVPVCETIKEIVVDYLAGHVDHTDLLPARFEELRSIVKRGFERADKEL